MFFLLIVNADFVQKKTWKGSMVSAYQTIRIVLPYFWPKGRLDLQIRVIIAILLIIAGKIVRIA